MAAEDTRSKVPGILCYNMCYNCLCETPSQVEGGGGHNGSGGHTLKGCLPAGGLPTNHCHNVDPLGVCQLKPPTCHDPYRRRTNAAAAVEGYGQGNESLPASTEKWWETATVKSESPFLLSRAESCPPGACGSSSGGLRRPPSDTETDPAAAGVARARHVLVNPLPK
eukprot:gene8872-biopygen9150